MAKILDIPAKNFITKNVYRIIPHPHSDKHIPYVICRYAVREALNIEPEYIRIRIYTKNPKRKGTIHVKRVGYNRYEWRGNETVAYYYIDCVVERYNEFWIVIEEITEKEAHELNLGHE